MNFKPYELGTDAADHYLNGIVLVWIQEVTQTLTRLQRPGGPRDLSFEHYDIATRRTVLNKLGEPELVRLTHDEADALAAQLPLWDAYRYDWDKKLVLTIANVESDLRHWERERTRISGLISRWIKQPLRTVEEEIQHQEQTRIEREAARTVARDAKISAEVVKIRKRIDSAVRNKNSATLADIFSSHRIREISGYRLTQDQAIELLERDAVWRAFGLLTPSGYAQDSVAKELLQNMKWGPKIPTTIPGMRFDYGTLPWPPELGGGVAKTR